MSEMVINIISGIAYLILAPVIGGLLAGVDRKISARMQRRVGPPIMQPFYDFFKLWDKQPVAVNKAQSFYVTVFGARESQHCAANCCRHFQCFSFHNVYDDWI